jgi:Alginate lyase
MPETPVLDSRRLDDTRDRLARGDETLKPTLAALTGWADRWLKQGPWSVMTKPLTAPSGDRHDYLSQAPYYWPSQPLTPDNPRGLPFVERDGERNPECLTGTDRVPGANIMVSGVHLTLAWYYTGNPAYVEHAVRIMRTWFADPATRMNPHLNYSQGIPGEIDGRPIGIIDFSQYFATHLDAVAILNDGAPGWTAADRDAITAWNAEYLDWLVHSQFGKEELAAPNNHGSFTASQIAALALAVGDRDLARRTVIEQGIGRIDRGIAADGTQPFEMSRTKTWHYHTFNLVALTRLAAMGLHVGVDVWGHRGPDGQTLADAVHFLLPTATGASPWPHPEIHFHRYAATDVVHACADTGDEAAMEAVPALEPPPGGDLWELRPAPQHAGDPVGSSVV